MTTGAGQDASLAPIVMVGDAFVGLVTRMDVLNTRRGGSSARLDGQQRRVTASSSATGTRRDQRASRRRSTFANASALQGPHDATALLRTNATVTDSGAPSAPTIGRAAQFCTALHGATHCEHHRAQHESCLRWSLGLQGGLELHHSTFSTLAGPAGVTLLLRCLTPVSTWQGREAHSFES